MIAGLVCSDKCIRIRLFIGYHLITYRTKDYEIIWAFDFNFCLYEISETEESQGVSGIDSGAELESVDGNSSHAFHEVVFPCIDYEEGELRVKFWESAGRASLEGCTFFTIH